MSKSTSVQPKIKKIRVIKNTEIKPKIKKINKKTTSEIQTITEMFSQITIHNPISSPSPPTKKRKSPINQSIDESSLDSITNKMAKLVIAEPRISISALDTSLLPHHTVFDKPHFAVLPVYIDINTIKSNYQKNIQKENIATLYRLNTRFLFEGPYHLDINEEPDELMDINIYLQDKYGIDEDNVSLIGEIKMVPNLTVYVAYVKTFLNVPTVYSWKAILDIYNHIQESYHYSDENPYPIKAKNIEYHYDENPYKAILNNAGTNLMERTVDNVIRMTHIYQNIMDNYETLLENHEIK